MTINMVIEIGFGSTWQTEDGSITWTDVSGYVKQSDGVQFSRGASSARGQVDVGEISFTLVNSDRRFDPTHTTGPYYGDLLPGVPIRAVTQYGEDALYWGADALYWGSDPLTWTGTLGSTLWRGTISTWPQRYDIGNTVSTVPIRGYDGFDKLARATVPRSVLEASVMSYAPRAFWPLRETSGLNMDEVTTNDRAGVFNTSMSTRAQTIDTPAGATYPALLADGGDRATVTASQAAVQGLAQKQTWACLIDISSVQGLIDGQKMTILERGVGDSVASWDASDPASWWGVEIVSEAEQTARMFWTGITSTAWDTGHGYSASFSYAVPRFVACYADFTGADVRHYIDGVQSTGTTDATALAYRPQGITFFGRKARTNGFSGLIANMIWHSTTVGTPAAIAVWADAAMNPLANQRSDQRLTYLLDELDWPTDLRDLDQGASILGPATFNAGDNALSYMRAVAATEYGRMFVSSDGSLTFRDRYAPFLDATSLTTQFTFTDSVPANGYAEFELDLDDELLVNVARVTRRGGTEQIATNVTSIGLYGEADTQLTDLLHTSDQMSKSQADWIVVSSANPLPRVPKILVPLHKYQTLDQIDVLGLEIGHRVTVDRTPQNLGSTISLDFLISGVRMRVDDFQWWAEFYVEPVPQDTISLFLLGTSLLDSVTSVLAY